MCVRFCFLKVILPDALWGRSPYSQIQIVVLLGKCETAVHFITLWWNRCVILRLFRARYTWSKNHHVIWIQNVFLLPPKQRENNLYPKLVGSKHLNGFLAEWSRNQGDLGCLQIHIRRASWDLVLVRAGCPALWSP